MPGTAHYRGFIPPYILKHLIANGSEPQRAKASGTLRHVNSLRHNPGPPTALPRQAAVAERGPAGELRRSVHDAQNGTQLPGKLVRAEGQRASGDPAVDEAYDALGATHDFFWRIYGRDSIDNRGFALVGTVHYDKDYQNAFWDGAQMVFGDGDGEIFNRFTLSLDVIAHELAHGVTESEAGLVYAYQSGALNESMSDVFGALTQQFVQEQTADQADWLIGADLLTDQVKGVALRSMANPGTAYDDPVLGKDPQPAHMDDYIDTQDDNGGVHLNSGIPNRAFYLASLAIGGFAWARAGQVWYDTLCDKRLSNVAEFSDFAGLTITNAKSRFSAEPRVAEAIAKAWEQVGVKPR
ncbi:M4 family metallopeptidase [Pseudomonas sp. nanlin1]|uniref:M4 family metallopeptidase n=1 Tax=Pseudomonas sp. nanlin1 TaxID=3040605 RepID=UPI00388EB00C